MSHLTTPALVRQLLMYALAHPKASDSAPGIARWWLEPGDGADPQALDEALELLVQRGAFAERVAADGRRSYRRIGSDRLLQRLLAISVTASFRRAFKEPVDKTGPMGLD